MIEIDEDSATTWFECNVDTTLLGHKRGKIYNASLAALRWKDQAKVARTEREELIKTITELNNRLLTVGM